MMLCNKHSMAFWAFTLAALFTSACQAAGDNFRYRLTAEVETPQGVKTGSSVIEVRTDKVRPITGEMVTSASQGEAVVVDLGSKGKLFVLLAAPGLDDWASTILQRMLPDTPDMPNEKFKDLPSEERQRRSSEIADAQLQYRRSQIAEAARTHRMFEVPERTARGGQVTNGYPYFVRFGDLRNPESVEIVDPHALSVAFGAGVRLRRLTIAPTDDPVTSGIEQILPWLRPGDDRRIRSGLGAVRLSDVPSAAIKHSHFKSG